ncbi:MAG: hypothetical protein NVSMB51_20180 [Solirubrobacteraceae bacterium]
MTVAIAPARRHSLGVSAPRKRAERETRAADSVDASIRRLLPLVVPATNGAGNAANVQPRWCYCKRLVIRLTSANACQAR